MRGLLGALGGARLARLSWSKTRACPLGSRPAFARRRAQEHTGVGALGPVVLASRAFSPAWAGPLEACSRTGQSRAFAEALPPAIDTLAECAPRPFRLCRGFWSLCQRRPRFRPGLRVLLSCCRASSSPSRRWRSSLCSCPGCETCSAAAAAMAAHCDAGWRGDLAPPCLFASIRRAATVAARRAFTGPSMLPNLLTASLVESNIVKVSDVAPPSCLGQVLRGCCVSRPAAWPTLPWPTLPPPS